MQALFYPHRLAGVLLHPTSLPNRSGLGTLGKNAYQFIDFMDRCGLGIWQILPLHPTNLDLSPYSAPSAFAGNPSLIDTAELVELNLLNENQLSLSRSEAIKQAFKAFLDLQSGSISEDFKRFKKENQFWLRDYALYIVIKDQQKQTNWTAWPLPLRNREPKALFQFAQEHIHDIDLIEFEQFLFFYQWGKIHQYAKQRNIVIFGDMPIFVCHDSADVWAHPHIFQLDNQGDPIKVTGVPPDYFSDVGQRWGNPLYDWQALEETHYTWWLNRVEHALRHADFIRIDHFRGFEACWEIPADEPTAIKGQWVEVPGKAFFKALFEKLGHLPLIAEDLGIITPKVEALRDEFNIPGMKVLHFAFSDNSLNPYLPHNHIPNSVLFTGTHDNNTTLGWHKGLSKKEKETVNQYLCWPQEVMPWTLIKCAFSSVSQWAIVPMQDILSLDGSHRMNTPGTTENNWLFQFNWEQLGEDRIQYLDYILKLYGRHKSLNPHP